MDISRRTRRVSVRCNESRVTSALLTTQAWSGPKKIRRRNRQGVRKGVQVADVEVALTTLNLTDVGAVQSSAIRECLLRQLAGLAVAADGFPRKPKPLGKLLAAWLRHADEAI